MKKENKKTTAKETSSGKNEDKENNEVIISRVFDAPIEKLWNLWINPGEIRKWWGPKEFSAPIVKIDFRLNGSYLYCMRGPATKGEPEREYCNVGEFLQITPMKKIVTKVSFSDRKGNPVRASYYEMPGEWPMYSTYTVSFEQLGDKTRLTVQGEGVPNDLKKNAQMGWEQQFDKIKKILK